MGLRSETTRVWAEANGSLTAGRHLGRVRYRDQAAADGWRNVDRVRLASSGALAGSTLTMDAAVRRAVHDLGLPVETAVAAATTVPASVLSTGRPDLGAFGRIAPGHAADLLILDDDLSVLDILA